ncbi:MAG: hypothetical protein ACM3KD_02870 [Hyphomicrobiaceae bacterium]
MTNKPQLAAIAALAALGHAAASADEGGPNNGTDPTKLATTAFVQYKHTDLRIDRSTGLFEANYAFPIGAAKNMSLAINLPYASGVADSSFGMGDASLKFTHVADLNKERGLAYTAEVIFDTASRDELGSGQTVLKASGFYAKFLEGGAIFVPAVVQQVNLSNNRNRAKVNNTTLDFYYVPKASPKLFMTYDPAVIFDWENHKKYVSLTVTFGTPLGKAFGGDSQIYIKPQVLGGGERPANWSVQFGYKVIGF